jgi:hypothetical protein
VTRRYLGILGSAALAAAVVLGGCSSAATSAATSAGTAAATQHDLTLAQAQAAYTSYVAASTAAAKQGSSVKALAIAADGEWSILHAQYAALTSSGTPVAQYSYGTPTFYVPALSSYPQWFMVSVPARTEKGSQTGPAADTLMVLVKTGQAEPWTLDGSAVLDQPLPALARDSDGYVTAVPYNDTSLLLEPTFVGATQAAVVDEGPAAPAAKVMAGGPQTTGLYTQQAAQGNAATARGLNYQWLMQSAAFAQWRLRTADGGALVMYTMYLNTVAEHPGNASGSPIPVPASFIPILSTPKQFGSRQVDANWTYEFAAIDPPASAQGAQVEVIGGTGAPTYGHAT